MERDVFVRLLVECAKDFALRSVPQISLMPSDGTTSEEGKGGVENEEEVSL